MKKTVLGTVVASALILSGCTGEDNTELADAYFYCSDADTILPIINNVFPVDCEDILEVAEEYNETPEEFITSAIAESDSITFSQEDKYIRITEAYEKNAWGSVSGVLLSCLVATLEVPESVGLDMDSTMVQDGLREADWNEYLIQWERTSAGGLDVSILVD